MYRTTAEQGWVNRIAELAGGTCYKGTSRSLSAFYPISYHMLLRIIEGRAGHLLMVQTSGGDQLMLREKYLP